MSVGVKVENLPLVNADEVSGTDEFVIVHTEDGNAKKIKLTAVSHYIQQAFAQNDVLMGRFPVGSISDLSVKFQGYLDTGFYLSDPPNGKVSFVSGGVESFSYDVAGLDTQKLQVHDIALSGNINNALGISMENQPQGYTFEPRELFHLSSPNAARLLIEADVNNVDESANAQILLEQDGGAVQGHLGYWNGTNSIYLWNRYNEDLVLGTNDKELIRLRNDNVGIGVFSQSPPTHKLSVQGDISIYEKIVVKGNSNTLLRFLTTRQQAFAR